jgi:nucleotide-binding universal stress UspA family protein
VYQKILVAVDGSKPSINALNHATELARTHNSQITAITVIEELKLPFAAHYGL